MAIGSGIRVAKNSQWGSNLIKRLQKLHKNISQKSRLERRWRRGRRLLFGSVDAPASGRNGNGIVNKSGLSLPRKFRHGPCECLHPDQKYPKITNVVVTVKLGRVIELSRLSMKFPNTGKDSKFPAVICKIDGGTSLIFTTGALLTPGCRTFYGAKYLCHVTRLMIESVPQPFLVVSRTGEKYLKMRMLRGLTSFDDFRVVNIVSNGRLVKSKISLARMEASDDRLNWNPSYFPGLEHVLTNADVPLLHKKDVSMTLFDSGKGVGMGSTTLDDTYTVYEYVAQKASRYSDGSSGGSRRGNETRFGYEQAQQRLRNIASRQQDFDRPTKEAKNEKGKISQSSFEASQSNGPRDKTDVINSLPEDLVKESDIDAFLSCFDVF